MRPQATLFELSGEHPSLPRAEVISCLEAETGRSELVAEGPGFVACSLRDEERGSIVRRLALVHRYGRYLGSVDREHLKPFVDGLPLPKGSVSVRVKRHQGTSTPEQARDLTKQIGAALSKGRNVDLDSAEVPVRVLLSDRLHFFIEEGHIDRDQYEDRHVRSRPFFSPISLHPRYARALVNLTQVRKGQTMLDPFCGTGGILIEAALMGAKVLGSDLSAEMIDGCAQNMRHFSARWERLEIVDVGDVLSTFGKVDAVATDPPYGRSASTMKEPVLELHRRALVSIADVLRPGGRGGIVLPWSCQDAVGLRLEQKHAQRVHRSLTRHYCLFRSPGR